MLALKILHVFVGVLGKQGLGGLVHGKAFAVHIGQQGKLAVFVRQLGKFGLGNGFLRQLQGARVLGEGLGLVAIDVARELVWGLFIFGIAAAFAP